MSDERIRTALKVMLADPAGFHALGEDQLAVLMTRAYEELARRRDGTSRPYEEASRTPLICSPRSDYQNNWKFVQFCRAHRKGRDMGGNEYLKGESVLKFSANTRMRDTYYITPKEVLKLLALCPGQHVATDSLLGTEYQLPEHRHNGESSGSGAEPIWIKGDEED